MKGKRPVINQIAEAFPLHFQRIVEETYRQHAFMGSTGMAIKMLDMQFAPVNAGITLGYLFMWERTAEGRQYWLSIASQFEPLWGDMKFEEESFAIP